MRSVILVVLLALLGNGSVSAEGLPTAEMIRKRIAAAAGTPPKKMTMVVTYELHGTRGRRTSFRIGDDVRSTIEEAPFAYQYGEFEKQAWHQNENGQTVLDQADAGLAKTDTITTTVAPIVKPVVGYLISSLNNAGFGSREYVEAATSHVVRADEVGAAETTTRIYDDFRTVDGDTRAWHWNVRDGHVENDGDYRVVSIVHDARASDVAIPQPRRALVDFPAGVSTLALPVQLRGGKFFVRLAIQGRGLDFLLDTGASGIVIDDDVVRQLGLATYGRYSSGVNARRYVGGSVLVPSVKIGDLSMTDVAMDTTPHLESDDQGGVKPVGFLGFDFIAALGLKLDYEHGEVTAYEGNAFVAPTTPHTIALDIRLASQQPRVDVTINGALGERFVIDTGAPAPLMLFDYFQRRHPEALVDRGGGGNARFLRFYGVGGNFQTVPYQLDSVRLGSAEFKQTLAYAVRSRASYGGAQDGLIGIRFLELFNVYLNYADSRIYLEPNAFGRSASHR
jgi:predicted aspartyl protease